MEDQKMQQCPICFKEFPSNVIQTHAAKCLFLNEPQKSAESQGSSNAKRPTLFSQLKSPVAKRPKQSSTTGKSLKTGKMVVSKTVKENGEKMKLSEEKPVENSSTSRDTKSTKKPTGYVPLSEKMRPSSLEDYLGQNHIIGPESMWSQLLKKAEIPNMILWGPPGCGKTSLANVVATICKSHTRVNIRYVKLSAAMSGVNEVKEAVNIATNELKFGRRTVMFMDEIHRFNKLQQDIFLPHIEAGTITLIGATTENPSFSLNSALLSRCRVVVLEKLSSKTLISILTRAVKFLKGSITSSKTSSELDPKEIPKFFIDEATIEWLAETCDGDARIALGGLELAVQSKIPEDEEFLVKTVQSITLQDVENSLKKSHMLYDRKGDQHYDIISALHKSVRASDENAALYWLARMMAGGEDPVYIARRLVRMSSEDVGLADPKALGIAVHTMHGCKMIGMPECDVLLAQCVIYLARAPKSRLMEDSLRAAQRLVANHKGPQPAVPLHLRNAPTKLMKELGCAKGYNLLHKDESGLTYLPEGLENVNFFGDEFDNSFSP